MLLVLDNRTGHETPAFVLWVVAHGVVPRYAPPGGSWLNMTDRRSCSMPGWPRPEQRPERA